MPSTPLQLGPLKSLLSSIVVPLAVTCTTLACDHQNQWEASRSHYCTELELLKNETLGELESSEERLSERANTPARERVQNQCLHIIRELAELKGENSGFDHTVHILSRGRSENESIEEAGFVLSSPLEVLQKITAEVSSSCPSKPSAAADAISKNQDKVARRFEARLDACRATGWQSSLSSTKSE